MPETGHMSRPANICYIYLHFPAKNSRTLIYLDSTDRMLYVLHGYVSSYDVYLHVL